METISKSEFISAITSHRSAKCAVVRSSKNPFTFIKFDKNKSFDNWNSAVRRSNAILFSDGSKAYLTSNMTYHRIENKYFMLEKMVDTEDYSFEQPYTLIGYIIR